MVLIILKNVWVIIEQSTLRYFVWLYFKQWFYIGVMRVLQDQENITIFFKQLLYFIPK